MTINSKTYTQHIYYCTQLIYSASSWYIFMDIIVSWYLTIRLMQQKERINYNKADNVNVGAKVEVIK